MHARIFAFGVGYDVNARFLDKLARENFGQSEYVRPDEDIEERVAKLYNRIESPVLTGVRAASSPSTRLPQRGGQARQSRLSRRTRSTCSPASSWWWSGATRRRGRPRSSSAARSATARRSSISPPPWSSRAATNRCAFVEKLWAIRRVGEILDELDLKGKNEELVKELVELATRHGILTPYTSFMADEGTNLHDVAGNATIATRRLMAMDQTGGAGGVAQRAMKGQLQNADKPTAGALADAFHETSATPTRRAPGRSTLTTCDSLGPEHGSRRRRSRTGAGPVMVPAASAPAQAAADLSYGGEVSREADAAEKSVRNIGNRTFYRRQGQWVDSQVTKQQQQNARRVKQFSDEYFDLAHRFGRTMSQYLAIDEPVVLNLGDQTYLIEP